MVRVTKGPCRQLVLQTRMISTHALGLNHFAVGIDMPAELCSSIFHAASLVELLHLCGGFEGELCGDVLPQLLASGAKILRRRDAA